MYLVDTHIVSELLRPRPNAGVLHWIASQREVAYAVTSVEEAIFGLNRKNNRPLLEGFERFVAERCTVYPVTEDIARRAGMTRRVVETGYGPLPARHVDCRHRPSSCADPGHSQCSRLQGLRHRLAQPIHA